MYRVEITNTGGSEFSVKSKDYEFVIDTRGKGVTPPDALLASLGSCIGVYVRKYMDSSKLNIEHLGIIVQAELRPEAPIGFDSIRVQIDIQGVQLDERRKQALLGFIKNCPVHNTLEAKPEVVMNLTVEN